MFSQVIGCLGCGATVGSVAVDGYGSLAAGTEETDVRVPCLIWRFWRQVRPLLAATGVIGAFAEHQPEAGN